MLAVYVDNFILAAVQDAQGLLLVNTMRAMLHAIHSIFKALTAADALGTKDLIYEKKLNKGDTCWDVVKEVLGYKLHGENHTVQLPAPKPEALSKELHQVLCKQRLPLKLIQFLMGRLQHAAQILPAAKSFFTPLNKALQGLPDFI
jgi:hypothetical protein